VVATAAAAVVMVMVMSMAPEFNGETKQECCGGGNSGVSTVYERLGDAKSKVRRGSM
jgi:hypothetical protein